MSADDIDAFWDWFAACSELIKADPSDDAVIAELDRRVMSLGCPAWEVGPGERADWFLALSPAGDPDVLPLTREIIRHAPTLSGWEFLPYRPRKQWDLRFEIESATGPLEVDARGWRFVAYRYPDGIYDLVIHVGSRCDLTASERDLAVWIAVEGQLGEEALLTSVNQVEAVAELSAAEVGRSRPLTELGVTGDPSSPGRRGS